jgi:hypothetical protein
MAMLAEGGKPTLKRQRTPASGNIYKQLNKLASKPFLTDAVQYMPKNVHILNTQLIQTQICIMDVR